MAVSKTMPPEAVEAAWLAGLRVFGENRVQEAETKIRSLRSRPEQTVLEHAGDEPEPAGGRGGAAWHHVSWHHVSWHHVSWHLVGHLQSNKAGKAVELFDLIHSVDDTGLAAALGRRAAQAGLVQAVLVQVNCSGEPSKSGCAPDEALALAEVVHRTPGLALKGFMTIGPLEPHDAEAAEAGARRAFRQLRTLRDAAGQALGASFPELSMGMTNDLEVAIDEGATLVRVGTALFGSRPAVA